MRERELDERERERPDKSSAVAERYGAFEKRQCSPAQQANTLQWLSQPLSGQTSEGWASFLTKLDCMTNSTGQGGIRQGGIRQGGIRQVGGGNVTSLGMLSRRLPIPKTSHEGLVEPPPSFVSCNKMYM